MLGLTQICPGGVMPSSRITCTACVGTPCRDSYCVSPEYAGRELVVTYHKKLIGMTTTRFNPAK